MYILAHCFIYNDYKTINNRLRDFKTSLDKPFFYNIYIYYKKKLERSVFIETLSIIYTDRVYVL